MSKEDQKVNTLGKALEEGDQGAREYVNTLLLFLANNKSHRSKRHRGGEGKRRKKHSKRHSSRKSKEKKKNDQSPVVASSSPETSSSSSPVAPQDNEIEAPRKEGPPTNSQFPVSLSHLPRELCAPPEFQLAPAVWVAQGQQTGVANHHHHHLVESSFNDHAPQMMHHNGSPDAFHTQFGSLPFMEWSGPATMDNRCNNNNNNLHNNNNNNHPNTLNQFLWADNVIQTYNQSQSMYLPVWPTEEKWSTVDGEELQNLNGVFYCPPEFRGLSEEA